MKISKSLLQVIALSVTVGMTAQSCAKVKKLVEPLKNKTEKPKRENTPGFDCPGCGMG